MNRYAASRTAALALGLATLPCLALERDRQQPVDFGADRFEGQIAASGQTRLSGNFWLEQGSLKIRAADAVIHREGGAVVRIVLNGAPATVEQDLDSGGRMHAEAREIDYRIGSDLLDLSRDVVVTQPEGQLRGERLRYDIGSGRIEGSGEGSGGVRMRIEPKQPASGG